MRLIRINDIAKDTAWNFILEYRPKPQTSDILQILRESLLAEVVKGNRVPHRFSQRKAIAEVRRRIKWGLFGRPKKS